MNIEQLIPVTTNENGQQVVSARELYAFLKIRTDFTLWCKRMFAYGFKENEDYTILLIFEENVSKNNPIDFALTLDTAKEISMLQRSEKGKKARKYFIEVEKVAKQVWLQQTQVLQPKSDEEKTLEVLTMLTTKVSQQNLELKEAAVTIQQKNVVIEEKDIVIKEKDEAIEELVEVIEEQKEDVQYTKNVLTSESTYTVTQIGNELGMSAPELNNILKFLRIQHKVNGQWVLYANHLNQGLTDTETEVKPTTSGKWYTAVQMKWTEKGRRFIHDKVNTSKIIV